MDDRGRDGASLTTGRWSAERTAIDTAVVAALDRYSDHLTARVADATRYALTGGGKRFRGLLVMLAHRACRGVGSASGLGAAVEIIHAYSLVHDDLPCMDDDDVRRGRPTVHRAFDVATATVTGVAMVPFAIVVAVDASDALDLDAGRRAAVIATLMRASGAGGMIGGQLNDLSGEGRELSADALEQIHRGKTGALIAAAAAVGGHAARADAGSIEALDRFGAAIGLAFQIMDDVLDATSTSEVLGKTAGRDAHLAKSTYVSQLGVDAARARARALVDQGLGSLRTAGIATPDLEALANVVLERRS